MNYPVWDLCFAGGGLLVAVIAVVHVYVAHFAVGGGLFLVFLEKKGYRENSPAILGFTKKHARFFLILSTVFGGITGVGIWFTISLLSPDATSTLINNFVFGWATEWVCFVGEIVALFVYYYKFGEMDEKDHLKIGWFYFIFAWLSLFFVNGIIDFMLTPGRWAETGGFWDGFFNPTMWPALFFRTALAFSLAGIFGFVTAVFIRDESLRDEMVKYCAKWLLVPFAFMVFFAFWYFQALPDAPKSMVMGRSPEIAPFAKMFAWLLPVLFVGGLIMAVRVSGSLKKPLAFLLLFIGLAYMGAFEWIRESCRRPYLIYGHIYSTSILADQEKTVNEKGLLKTAKWVRHREITDENMLEAGKEIFRISCISCHSVGGPMNDILPLTKKYNVFGMDAQLDGQGKVKEYMPRFMGTEQERLALARYIVEGLHEKKEVPGEESEPVPTKEPPANIPEFDEENADYVLLSWNDIAMRGLFDSSPQGSHLYAQLIRRGETPEIVSEDVETTCRAGSGTDSMKMEFDEEKMAFAINKTGMDTSTADGLSKVLLTIEAKDPEGNILAATKTVLSSHTEKGCRKCHGDWKDVLSVHDRSNHTDISNKSDSCVSCHTDSDSEKSGQTNLPNLSAAIHGFHANYLTNRESDACHSCHSSSMGPPRFFRGIHKKLEMDCVNCHSTMEDLALSLLVREKQLGKKGADRMMKNLVPRAVGSVDQVRPRAPWTNQPDCMNCHVDFQQPETDESEFNKWTENADELFRSRSDDAGIMCQACHGTAHSLYPAENIFEDGTDNIQPMQYQENSYPIGSNGNCKICHTIDMEDEMHHPNILGTFRNID